MAKASNECSKKKGRAFLKKKNIQFGIQSSESKEVASFLIYHFCHIPANFTKFLKCTEALMQVNSSALLLQGADVL